MTKREKFQIIPLAFTQPRGADVAMLNFEEIVDRYYPMLYRFALSLARNEADACDLTQETFSIWAEKGHLLRDSSKAKSWLFTTLYREFISNRRHETRWPKEEISEVENELPCAMPETIDRLEATQVMDALQRLEENFRVPLVLYYMQDHSYEEIAQILEIPIGTVMSRLSRGKQKLQQAFLHPPRVRSSVLQIPKPQGGPRG